MNPCRKVVLRALADGDSDLLRVALYILETRSVGEILFAIETQRWNGEQKVKVLKDLGLVERGLGVYNLNREIWHKHREECKRIFDEALAFLKPRE